MTWLVMSCSFCVTPACASGNMSISLSIVCALGPNQWAIHVPLGKLKTERWFPWTQWSANWSNGFVFCGRHCTQGWPFAITSATRPLHVDSQTPRCPAGCRSCRRHYRRHRRTPISTHLWNGDAAGGRLGHKSPHMTLEYLEITQQDLQREFHLALSHPRHLVPSRTSPPGPGPRAD